MADAKYRDLILDTIDQLRKRKARPDLERISHMLDRRHGVSASEVETDLEKLVDGEIVIKVDYKGSTSYRNAAKWRRSHLGGHVLNSSDTSLFIGNIIATLCGDSGDREQGVSIHDVEKYVGTEKPDSDLCTKGRLLVALQREVDVGALKRLPNGNYARGNPADVKKASKLHGKGLGHGKAGGPGQGKSSGGPGKAGSTPGRKAGQTAKRKRLKTDASPERHHESSDSRPLLESGGHNTAASTADADDRCDYCLLTADGNPSDEAEGLLVCKDCHAKAHPSCMNYSADLALRSRMSPWQCFDCKTCNVCYDSGEGDSMLFCDACDKGYHMKCHTPKVAKKPTGKWVCFKCEHDGVRDPADNGTSEAETASQDSSLGGVDGLDGASCLPTPCDSPVNGEPMNMYATAIKTDEMLNKVGECHPGSDEIPDASDWAIEEVVNYFIDVGFLDQAAAFREQEIDGKSLLLMKRSDVLTGLNLKLGPALKIYSHVRRLQIRENSPSDFLL